MKYKVGDKVRVVKELYRDGFSVGEVVVISRVGGSCSEILRGDFTWEVYEDEIEPVGTETEENKGSKMLEVGKTYVDVLNRKHVCLFITNDFAYMVFEEGDTAYVWDKNTGKSLSLNSDYDIQTETVFKEA